MTAQPPRRIRRSARLLVEDADGGVLLFRFTAPGRPSFWATPGGECDQGGDFAAAARRELQEETGISLDPGPNVAVRTSEFSTFDGEPITAGEAYFHVRVATGEIDTGGHTELERQVMRSHRWFSRRELADWPETIFPEDLLAYLPEESPT